jgi:hypothetical protein
MVTKYEAIFHCKILQIFFPNWDFWFENKPSGNHDPRFTDVGKQATLPKVCHAKEAEM